MVRVPCCERMGLKKGPWTAEEDQILISYIQRYGHENWRALPRQAGLLRCGKSCRLRWTNYLRPDIKRGNFTKEEQEIIIKLHQMLGNRWSAIATKLPGRTDNEIKNYWHTHLKKRVEENRAAMASSGRLTRFSSSILGTNDGRLIPTESLISYVNSDDHPADAGNNYFQKNGYYTHNNLHYGQQNHHRIFSSVEDSSSAAAVVAAAPMQNKRDQILKKNSSSGGGGAEETSYGKISAVVQGLFPFTNKYYYSMAASNSRAQILSTTGEYSAVLQQPWIKGNEYCNNSDMDFWYNLFVKSQENQGKVI